MLYALTMRQTYLGQEVLNVFHYVSAGIPAAVSGSFGLASAFGAVPSTSLPTFPVSAPFWRILEIMTTQLNVDEVQVAALYDDTDFYSVPYGGSAFGQVNDSQATAPFIATGFSSNRVNRAIRRGFKRFAAVGEGQMDSGGNLSSGALAAANTAAAAMSAVLTYTDEGNTLSYSPVVLSFEKYTTDSGKTAYRPYATLAEQLTHMAQGILYSPYPQVRSQTSRQYGRGA